MAGEPAGSRECSRQASQWFAVMIDGLDVHVVRKPIRNMYLRIKPPEGRVEISAPVRMADAAIVSFVRSRRSWIDANWNAIRRQAQQAATTGAVEWNDDLRRAAAASINKTLPALLARWEPIIGRSPTHITLRTMTSRWGSCTPKTGRIRLNLQLGLMDRKFLEYVLVHEMTHLWEHGHGAGFQRRMSAYLPDWRKLRRELNQYMVLR